MRTRITQNTDTFYAENITYKFKFLDLLNVKIKLKFKKI